MSLTRATHVVNLSWQPSSWNWLSHAMPEHRWTHHTSNGSSFPSWLPARETWARILAAVRGAWAARGSHSVLVSHGPIPAMWGALAHRVLAPRTPHLIYAFNFTDLPSGLRRQLMGWGFRNARKLVVFSEAERTLYAAHFGIQKERIEMWHWSAKPLASPPPDALTNKDQVCAIGSQGRDYRSLIEAMRLLPHRKLVIIAHPANLEGLPALDNVELRTQVPLTEVAAVMSNSRFMVLPLRDAEVPCGHVTIVSAFHAGLAVLATDSSGIHDYIQQDSTGHLVRPNDPKAMAQAIEHLWADPSAIERLGQAGLGFAQAHCSETATVLRFKALLTEVMP